MKSIKREVIKYTTKDFLLNFIDLSVFLSEVFGADKKYKTSISRYQKWREADKEKFDKLFSSLKHRGFIKEDQVNEELVLTKKAIGNLKKYCLEIVEIPKQKKWDKKFRIVIFDIPEKLKLGREVLRCKLKELKFEKVQGSVYAYPFPCKKELEWIRQNYQLEPYVIYMEVEYLDGAEKIIERFVKNDLIDQ